MPIEPTAPLFATTPIKPVFFLHVTKCGGTSMRRAVKKALARLDVHPAQMYELNAPQTTELAKRTGIESFALRDILLSSQLERDHAGLVAGHFRYTSEFHERSLDKFLSITVLREPVDRFLSLFYYNSFKDTDYGKETLSLDEYITKPRARRCAEDYVRLFRGTGASHQSFATADDIEHAKVNLKKFDLVGQLDNMDKFIAEFQDRMGVTLKPEKLNKSPAPAQERYAVLPIEIMDEIEKLCKPSTDVFNTIG